VLKLKAKNNKRLWSYDPTTL